MDVRGAWRLLLIMPYVPSELIYRLSNALWRQKEPLPGWIAAPKLNYMSIARARLGLEGLLDGDSAGDGGTDHGVVAHADETHHVDVRGHGGRTGELGVGVHTAHGVGHAVRGRAGAHVVRVQGTASAATRSDGEVLLASLEALLLVGASDGVLEARGLVELPVIEMSTFSCHMMATPRGRRRRRSS